MSNDNQTEEAQALEEVWRFWFVGQAGDWDRLMVHAQRLKSALWLAIGKIVDEETLEMGVNATPQFIVALTEMVWAQIGMSNVVFEVHKVGPLLNGFFVMRIDK